MFRVFTAPRGNTQGDVPQNRGEGGVEHRRSRDAAATGREVPGCGSPARDGALAWFRFDFTIDPTCRNASIVHNL